MKRNNRERGVALLLALGFSALLLVLVMAFATNALLENKVANANSSREKGRVTGEVALSRALAAVRFYEYAMRSNGLYDQGLFRFDNVVSRSNAGEYDSTNPYFVGLKDSLPSLTLSDAKGHSHTFQTLRLNGDIVYYYPDATLDSVLDPDASRPVGMQQMQWQYVYDSPPAGEGTAPRIIGRFAYSVLPDAGTLHKSLFRDYSLNGTRLGTTPNEFPFEAVFRDWLDNGSGSSLSGVCNALHDSLHGADDYRKAYQIRPVLTATLPNAATRKVSDTPRRLYGMMDYSHHSAYSDSNYVSENDAEQQYFDWATSGTKDLLPLADIAGKDVAGLRSALPYLNRMKKESANTFSSEDDWRNQVAANIIDYCDSDNLPKIAYGSDGMPTYTGNEKTPYIESLGVALSTQWDGTYNEILDADGNVEQREWTFVGGSIAGACVFGRVMNYFSAFSSSCTLQLSGSVRIHGTASVNGTSAPITEREYAFSDLTVPVSVSADGYYSGTAYQAVGESLFSRVNETTPSNATFSASVTFDTVKIEKAILKDGSGNVIDYAKNLDGLAKTATVTIPLQTNANFNNQYASASFLCDVRDPRQNLNPGDWTFQTPGIGNVLINSDAQVGFSAHSNSVAQAADTSDKTPDDEKASGDPLTTALYAIRNGTMATAAEFSLIHRGEAYKTLNLTKAAAPEKTEVSYTDGDAGILDQIRLGDLSKTAKIDVNTRDALIWQLIFQDVNYSPVKLNSTGDALDTSANDTALTAAQAAQLATAMRKILRIQKIFFKSPSQILASVTDASCNAVTNDATVLAAAVSDAGLSLNALQQEALAAKVIPLLKASRFPDTFKILILAQSIQDVGGEDGTIAISRVKADGSTVSKDCALGTFDFEYNSGDILYFDRITSDVRMIATVKRTEDSTGKSTFTVERIEYLTEGQ